jgi:crotonobetainyl-CoA:carnitine CoA-transferase CaiB-like acyl-CoA transferase
MNNDGLARDSRYASAAGRLEHRDAIDASIAGWSRSLDRGAIESLLQAHGVPCHQVQNSADAYADPQFTHRGHFVALRHPSLGKFTVEGPRAKLSRTPAVVRRAAPALGQDNQHVLESILGYDETRISELVASGALG